MIFRNPIAPRPFAVSIAGQLGVNVDSFLMAVAVGASCAFLTPIGHQNNTLIMGPAGYRFGDYWHGVTTGNFDYSPFGSYDPLCLAPLIKLLAQHFSH